MNKQMVKAGIDEIPNLYGLIAAINKKEGSSQYIDAIIQNTNFVSKREVKKGGFEDFGNFGDISDGFDIV